MPTHLGGEPGQTPSLARGSSAGRALTERPACFEIEPRGVRSSAPFRMWCRPAAHHCSQLRIRSPLHDVRQPASRGSWIDAIQNRLHGRANGKRDTIALAINRGSTQTRLGGARRDRTDDLMLAKHALSQLSYGPGSERIRA